MARERILVAVKTYPVPSRKYGELTCTAGFRENGSWIRLYPLPFRRLDHDKRYKKYQWIEADITPNLRDHRPESYNVLNTDTISLLDSVPTGRKRDWHERKRLILERNTIYQNKAEIIEKAHANKLSLAIFKPRKILKFVAEKNQNDWNQERKKEAIGILKQKELFDKTDVGYLELVRKIPYKFSYIFLDNKCNKSKLMIEDWELGVLYWNCFGKNHSEEEAIQKVHEKYMDDFALKRDIYLFLGTTAEHHNKKASNPFVVIGVFPPPKETQLSLF